MRLCVAGAYGAFGTKHLEALDAIDDVTVTAVMGPNEDKINALAAERGIGFASTSLEACIARDDVDAVYVATIHPKHCECTVLCLEAGKASR